MDDQQAYLLNGLIARAFALGRIVRFRKVDRGRQTAAYELFTAEEKEFLVQLYPASFRVESLEMAAGMVNSLDAQRFSVMPFVTTRTGTFVAEGPQNTHLLVTLAPTGSVLTGTSFTEQDIAQAGLRLAWMHRLMREQRPELPQVMPLVERLREGVRTAELPMEQRERRMGQVETIAPVLNMATAKGWVHGDFQATSLLMDSDHQLRAIMDWGLLHVGSPLEDIVDGFMSLCRTTDGPGIDLMRGRALLESYHSLVPIDRIPWTPVVASWAGQRLLDFYERRRELPPSREFDEILQRPENLATAMASCLN